MSRLIALTCLLLLLTLGADSAWPQAHYAACYIAGAGTTLCRTGRGVFYSLTINSKGTLATVYDALSATGTPIAIIDTSLGIGTLTYNLNLATGLTVVTTGASTNLTVSTD